MKKWLLLLLFLSPLSVFAQTPQALNQFCYQGAVSSLTSGLSSTNKMQGIVPYCTVTVYLTGTTNLATIYSNSSSTPLTNPFQANQNGSFLLYAATGVGYDIQFSGGVDGGVVIVGGTVG